jgi:hypothetical protein
MRMQRMPCARSSRLRDTIEFSRPAPVYFFHAIQSMPHKRGDHFKES